MSARRSSGTNTHRLFGYRVEKHLIQCNNPINCVSIVTLCYFETSWYAAMHVYVVIAFLYQTWAWVAYQYWAIQFCNIGQLTRHIVHYSCPITQYPHVLHQLRSQPLRIITRKLKNIFWCQHRCLEARISRIPASAISFSTKFMPGTSVDADNRMRIRSNLASSRGGLIASWLELIVTDATKWENKRMNEEFFPFAKSLLGFVKAQSWKKPLHNISY